MKIEISNGELLDKFSILSIKLNKIIDADKLCNIRKEYESLKPLCDEFLSNSFVKEQFDKLLEVNLILWDIEDNIREKERTQLFDEEFVYLARNVYITNDKRASIKKVINVLTESEFIEEKSYSTY